jgi:uncharacterized repeat protein (TIGR01451 family)
MKIKFLSGVMLSSALLFLFVLGAQGSFISKALSNSNQSASVISSKQKENIYNIYPSKEFPGAFNFNYVFEKTKSSSAKEANFDLPIIPFDDELARKELGDPYADFGRMRDAWNYPVKENAFMKKEQLRKQSFLDSLKTNKAVAYDEDTLNPGVYNCRANTSVTGYFKAYFEDVVLDTNLGFDDPSFGEGRREEACQVLEDMSELLMLDTTTVTPDIIFTRSDQPLPPGALAGASSYFGYYTAGPDNGSLHKHIISRQDPTPGEGNFDAFVITNFSGINWSVDSSLNGSTYDLYSVMWHEMMHALGFRSLLPAVIPQTGVEHRHGTFDYHTYKDEALQNRFITAITNIVNVPVGAPSPWFVTNQVVYRGVKNILNATPDGIRPVYSPTSWQQGSSLSHFDMNRSGGEEYVMHPSIGTNTERDIHEHEREVLCHLGYMVEGMEGCEVPTPVAVDDFVELNGVEPVCVNLLGNDVNPGGLLSDLRINTLAPVSIQPGDSIQYFVGISCSGATMPNPFWARSMSLTPIDSSPRFFEYTNINLNTDRVSFPAKIIINPSCESITDSDEYVCNGDFEVVAPDDMLNKDILCPPNVSPSALFWQPYFCPQEWSYYVAGIIIGINSYPSFFSDANENYIADVNAGFPIAFTTNLKQPLVSGEEYVLYFDVLQSSVQSNNTLIFGLNNENRFAYGSSWSDESLDQVIDVSSSNGLQMGPAQINSYWYRHQITFIPQADYESLVFGDLINKRFLDNISIRQADAPPPPTSLSGHLYLDQNQNSSSELNEPRLPGIQVGLFQSGNNTPIQTVNTQDLPNLGKYEFTNLPEGQYYIGLIVENLYQSVTEPGVSIDPFSTYNHMHTVNLSDDQTLENLDFGVTLQPGVTQNTNIVIKKDLIDSSLSIFDRFVTWRIRVINNGQNIATNINISDFLPEGITYFSYNNQNELETYNQNSGIYYIPELSPGEATYIDITTKVPLKACGPKTNTASLESMDQTDTFLLDNEASATLSLKPCFPTALEGKF